MKIRSIILSTSIGIFTIFIVSLAFQTVYAQTTPTITHVSDIIPAKTQTIVITGSGFGNQMPYTNQDSPYIEIRDKTGNWNAGNSYNPANLVTLDVSKWTDSEIIITGFDGTYGNDWSFNYGDLVDVYVFNISTNTWLQYATTISPDRDNPPTLYLYPPTINGLTVTINGVTNPTTQGASITRITWDWGDGQSSTGWFPQSHTYSNSGTYPIKIISYDSNNQWSWSIESINVSSIWGAIGQAPAVDLIVVIFSLIVIGWVYLKRKYGHFFSSSTGSSTFGHVENSWDKQQEDLRLQQNQGLQEDNARWQKQWKDEQSRAWSEQEDRQRRNWEEQKRQERQDNY